MDPPPTRSRIRQGSMASVRFMAEHRAYFTLLDVERSEPTLAEVLRDGSDVYAADVVRLIIEAQADGTVAPGDPQLHAVGVLGAVSSLATRCATAPSMSMSTRSPRPSATGWSAASPPADCPGSGPTSSPLAWADGRGSRR